MKPRKSTRRATIPRPSGASTRKAQPANAKPGDKAAEAAFVKSLVASGQAARPDPDGKLPDRATHELVETEKGEVKAVRRRFSAF